MNEEKINQILKNQKAIFKGLLELLGEQGSDDTDNYILERYGETHRLLNPPKEQSIKELTEESLGDREIIAYDYVSYRNLVFSFASQFIF